MVRTHYLRGAATLAFQAYQYQRRLEEGDDSLNLDFNTGSKAGDAVLTWFLVFVMVFRLGLSPLLECLLLLDDPTRT